MGGKLDYTGPTVVPKVASRWAWDSGVACCASVLAALGISTNYVKLAQEVETQSIWAIDLAVLLTMYGVSGITYYTTSLEDRRHNPYLRDKDPPVVACDISRLHTYFSQASEKGIELQHRLLLLDDVKRYMMDKHVVIAFVNERRLKCRHCRSSPLHLPRLPYLTRRFQRTPFRGTYISLIAYDGLRDIFVYRDPRVKDDFCVIRACDLEVARCCWGTEHDAVVVPVGK